MSANSLGESVPVSIELYVRRHGRKPRGRAVWGFRLVSASVTHNDYFFYSKTETPYERALAAARSLAQLRRAQQIALLP